MLVVGVLQRERTLNRTETVKLNFLTDRGLVLAEGRCKDSLGRTVADTGFDIDTFLVKKMRISLDKDMTVNRLMDRIGGIHSCP